LAKFIDHDEPEDLADPNNWFVAQPDFDQQQRSKPLLVCFHGAGASAVTFHRWRKTLSEHVDMLSVQLPRRDQRVGESQYSDFTRLGLDLLPQLRAQIKDRRCVFVGHSMGGILARHMAQLLATKDCQIEHLIAIAAFSPLEVVAAIKDLHQQSDKALESTFVEFAELAESPIKQKLLEVLRADLLLLSTYQNIDSQLNCDVTLFAGHQDNYTTIPHSERWLQHVKANNLGFNCIDGEHGSILANREIVKWINDYFAKTKNAAP
jgi:medium-chain acyl-[acyl-carrier-protein] hydrolase